MSLEIGDKLRRLRLANSLTQEELANRAYVTKGFISQLERDLTSPSIVTLKVILDVLGEELAGFFKEESPEKEVYRKQDRVVTSDSTDKLKVELLVPGAQSRLMDPVFVTLSPGEKTWEEVTHEGEEFGLIVAGKVLLHLDKATYKMNKGDCFYFTADKAHYVENTGNTMSRILWVVSPPIF
ncbi:MAG: cupin domain-containing protein [Pseudomonadota bacterium]